jgi:hypothetical protein
VASSVLGERDIVDEGGGLTAVISIDWSGEISLNEDDSGAEVDVEQEEDEDVDKEDEVTDIEVDFEDSIIADSADVDIEVDVVFTVDISSCVSILSVDGGAF